jgi:hypothetical protein
VIITPYCWRCGQALIRPESRFCDNCGASVSGSNDYVTPDERTNFDRNVATLFTLVGIGAIIVGVIGGIGALSLGELFPGIWAYSALAVIGGLAAGGILLYLAHRIKEKI